MPIQFFTPPTLETLIRKKDIQGLKKLLVKTYPSKECEAAAKALAGLGYQAERDEAGAVLALLERDFDRAAVIGLPAVEPLVHLLRDPVTWEQSFRTVPGVDENGELSGVSYEMTDTVRHEAKNALIAIGPAAVPALVQILVREGSRLGRAFEPVLSALVEIGNPRAMDGFLHILKTEPKAVNFLLQLKFAMRKFKDARVVPLLRALLADRYLDGTIRWEAEQVLRELGEQGNNH